MNDERMIWICDDEWDAVVCVDEDDRDARIDAHRRHFDCGYAQLSRPIPEGEGTQK